MNLIFYRLYSGQGAVLFVKMKNTKSEEMIPVVDYIISENCESEMNDISKSVLTRKCMNCSVRERSRGRKSPVSWSQKVRHQWHKSPKPKSDDKGQ